MFKEKFGKILRRIAYVIFAFAAAVSLWLYVEITENEMQQVNVPNIGFVWLNENLLNDRGLLISSFEPESLSITFEASRSIASRLIAPGALTAQVDLTGITSAGTTSLVYTINFPSDVNPNAVDMVGWSARRVTLVIDRMSERQIPVHVEQYTGGASDGFVAEAAVWDPQYITARGPDGIVSKIYEVRVSIPRANLAATYSDELEFIPYDENGEPIDPEYLESVVFSQDTIRVTVPVNALMDLTLVVLRAHGVSTSDENTNITIDPPQITVSGDPDVISGLDSVLTLGTIDMLSFPLSDTEEFVIRIPDLTTSVTGERTATVHVEILNRSIDFRSTDNIHVVNTPVGYTAQVRTRSLDIRLRGTADELAQISDMNLRVVADLTEFSLGVSRVRARVYIDGLDVNVDAFGEYFITVELVPSE